MIKFTLKRIVFNLFLMVCALLVFVAIMEIPRYFWDFDMSATILAVVIIWLIYRDVRKEVKSKLNGDLYDEVRINQIIHLPSQPFNDSAEVDGFQCFLDDVVYEDPEYASAMKIRLGLYDFIEQDEEEYPHPEDFGFYFGDKKFPGMLAEIHSPVRHYEDDGFSDIYSSSWGHLHTGWVYAKDFNEMDDEIGKLMAYWEKIDRARVTSVTTRMKFDD